MKKREQTMKHDEKERNKHTMKNDEKERKNNEHL